MANVKTLDEILVETQKQIDGPVKGLANAIEMANKETERKFKTLYRDQLTEPELYGEQGLPTMREYIFDQINVNLTKHNALQRDYQQNFAKLDKLIQKHEKF